MVKTTIPNPSKTHIGYCMVQLPLDVTCKS